MLNQKRRISTRLPSPSTRLVIFVLLLLYFSIDIWTAKHYLGEEDLPRRIQTDLGNEVIEPLIHEYEPITCTQPSQQCSPIPLYGKLAVEANGFSCDKTARGIEQPRPKDEIDFEQEFRKFAVMVRPYGPLMRRRCKFISRSGTTVRKD